MEIPEMPSSLSSQRAVEILRSLADRVVGGGYGAVHVDLVG
tara:strand:- start:109 stop:231 length:123 start_codon:yes stop_codon:yes gene_type:complete